MTPGDFRSRALRFPGTVESSHMDHPDFRIGGKIFATLGYPHEGWAMVKLPPEQQALFVQKSPLEFRRCKGFWGERGCTNVHLASSNEAQVQAALRAAYENVRPKVKKARSPKRQARFSRWTCRRPR
jgi:hypothetical protein